MEPIFDHEKLDVYGLQLQFVAWTADFLFEASGKQLLIRIVAMLTRLVERFDPDEFSSSSK